MPNDNPVAIFWDYENCNPSSSLSGHDIANQIRRLAHDFGCVTIFRAYLDLSEQSNKSIHLRSELQSSAISLIDCPHNGRKDVADKMILVDMMAFAIDHPAPATVVLISGDRDYAYAVSVLRLRRYSVALVVPPHVHTSLKSQASKVFDWHNDVLRPVFSELETLQPGAQAELQADTRLVDYMRSLSDADRTAIISSAYRATDTRLSPDLPQVGGINALESAQRTYAPQLSLSSSGRLNSDMAPTTSSDRTSSTSGIVTSWQSARSPDFPTSTTQLTSPEEDILDRSFTNVTPGVKRFDLPVNARVDQTGPIYPIPHTAMRFMHNGLTPQHLLTTHSSQSGALSGGVKLSVIAPAFVSTSPSSQSAEAVVAWRSNIPETGVPEVTKPKPECEFQSDPGGLQMPNVPGDVSEVMRTLGLDEDQAVEKFSQWKSQNNLDHPQRKKNASNATRGNGSQVGSTISNKAPGSSRSRESRKKNDKSSATVSKGSGNAAATPSLSKEKATLHRPEVVPAPRQTLPQSKPQSKHQPASSKSAPPQTLAATNGVGKSPNARKSETSLPVNGNGNGKSHPGGKKSSSGVLSAKDSPSPNPPSAALVNPARPFPSSQVSKLPDIILSQPGKPVTPLPTPTPAIPAIFNPLIDQLTTYLKSGNPKPLRSKLGRMLRASDQDIYKKAGVGTFTEYLTLAEGKGLIILGGVEGREWVGLGPG